MKMENLLLEKSPMKMDNLLLENSKNMIEEE